MGSCLISNHFKEKIKNEEPKRFIKVLSKLNKYIHLLSVVLGIVVSFMLFPLDPMKT